MTHMLAYNLTLKLAIFFFVPIGGRLQVFVLRCVYIHYTCCVLLSLIYFMEVKNS